MERPKLSEGLVWRQKPNGGYYQYIYFKKMYRGHDLRQSSKTDDPKEAERRLRRKLAEIDAQEVYGVRPKRTFSEGAEKLITEFQGSPKTLMIYAAQADLLKPWIGCHTLPVAKDDLRGFIEHRYSEGVSVRTVNLSIEIVRRVNRLAFHTWRDQKTKLSWTDNTPSLPFEKGPSGIPYRLSWEEQETFLDLLPGPERRAALFAVNTGLRDGGICRLEWNWEKYHPALKETVFEIPSVIGMKGKTMVLVLNRLARQVVDFQRGKDDKLVFAGMKQITTKAWYRAWKLTGLPMGPEWKKGVHNLRHTFAKRLRDAAVDERDVENLMNHVPKSVTRHYSAPELRKLKEAVERIVPKPKLVEVA